MAIPTLVRRLVGVLAAVALAIGFAGLAGTPAEAARKKSVWDKVATCESGNRWHINTGNGYYGGLQFSSSTWRAFGGGRYAPKAHKASRAEQIAIARRVLAGQGPGAWPTCSRKAGLTRANGKASRKATPASNPGVTKKAPKSTPPKKRAATPAPSAGKSKIIRVQRGDTLSKLAGKHRVKGGWRVLWRLNKKTLKNPNTLRVGQRLTVRV